MTVRESRPFAKYRVLDLSEGVAGPFATRLLAGYGFDVIKVERPGSGDWTRAAGPFPPGGPHPELSGLFLYLNVAKRSITLNFEQATGRDLLRRLARRADIIVESLGPGRLAALGIDHETLAAERPALVITSISPFGQTGPNKEYKGPEIVLQALSGFLYRNGLPEREPLKAWGYQAQFIGGTNAACGTLGAFLGARLKGRGQHVDVSIQETVIQFLHGTLLNWAFERKIQGRTPGVQLGNHRLPMAADGEVLMAVGAGGAGWRGLVEHVGDPRLLDPMFETAADRASHPDELDEILLPWLREQTREDFYQALQAKGVPVGYVRTPGDILGSAHELERGFIKEYPHSILGAVRIPGPPFILEKMDWSDRPPPELGEHTGKVLGDLLGITENDLSRLRALGAI
jgi:crotonobetainyl-CoA:carnitine CoA-transferase CaiB-like acyl-CoA transferase